MAKHAGQSRNFTIKAYEVQQVKYETTWTYLFEQIRSDTISWLGSNNKGRNIHVYDEIKI